MPSTILTDPFAPEVLPRRVMPLIFMVDTSGSMLGAKIGSLNAAVREALNEVSEISKNNADAQIKVAALEFSSGASWMYDKLIEAESFQWQDLQAAGLTSFGAACEELNQKLSQSHGWMTEPTGTRLPAIILLSDGGPTDEWKHALDKLKGNPWFKNGCKIAIAIGDDADKDVLTEFTGNVEAVLEARNVDQLKMLIKTVSATVSKVNSQSASAVNPSGPTSNNDPATEVVKKVKPEIPQPDPAQPTQGDPWASWNS